MGFAVSRIDDRGFRLFFVNTEQKKNRKREEQEQQHASKRLPSILYQADGAGGWHERADDWKRDVAVREGAHGLSPMRTACRSTQCREAQNLNQTSSTGKVMHQRGHDSI